MTVSGMHGPQPSTASRFPFIFTFIIFICLFLAAPGLDAARRLPLVAGAGLLSCVCGHLIVMTSCWRAQT